jgi:hypothetical protein
MDYGNEAAHEGAYMMDYGEEDYSQDPFSNEYCGEIINRYA